MPSRMKAFLACFAPPADRPPGAAFLAEPGCQVLSEGSERTRCATREDSAQARASCDGAAAPASTSVSTTSGISSEGRPSRLVTSALSGSSARASLASRRARAPASSSATSNKSGESNVSVSVRSMVAGIPACTGQHFLDGTDSGPTLDSSLVLPSLLASPFHCSAAMPFDLTPMDGADAVKPGGCITDSHGTVTASLTPSSLNLGTFEDSASPVPSAANSSSLSYAMTAFCQHAPGQADSGDRTLAQPRKLATARGCLLPDNTSRTASGSTRASSSCASLYARTSAPCSVTYNVHHPGSRSDSRLCSASTAAPSSSFAVARAEDTPHTSGRNSSTDLDSSRSGSDASADAAVVLHGAAHSSRPSKEGMVPLPPMLRRDALEASAAQRHSQQPQPPAPVQPPPQHAGPAQEQALASHDSSLQLGLSLTLPRCSNDAVPSQLPPPAHPADNFLRFINLEKCYAELRDLSFIGSGSSGNVYSGTWCGVPVAVKFMLSNDISQLNRQQREAALSRLASHPHLVQTYAVAAEQLQPTHFNITRRLSNLLNTDLLGTCVGGGTATDLYGTDTLSVVQSAEATLRQSYGMLAPDVGGPLHCSGQPSRSPQCNSGAPSGAHSASPKGLQRGSSTNDTITLSPQGVEGTFGSFNHCRQQVGGGKENVRMAAPPQYSGTSGAPDDAAQAQAVPPCAHAPPPRGGRSQMARGGNASALLAMPRDRRSRAQLTSGGASVHSALATAISTVDIDTQFPLKVDDRADSFDMAAEDPDNKLAMRFQMPDVLHHIGARPGQWLTVVIMEEMDRGSLHRSIHGGAFHPTASTLSRRHRVRGMVRTLVEIAQGMCHLHSAGLMHGDLKPANVLLKANPRDVRGFIAKVSDLGVTRAMADGAQATVSTSEWGTVIYSAPEVFNGKCCLASDVYSFGALTWHLTTGQLPHEELNPFAVMLAVSRGELNLDWPASVPRPLRKLGKLCMQHDAAARPSFYEIARALLRLEASMRQHRSASNGSAASPPPTTPRVGAAVRGSLSSRPEAAPGRGAGSSAGGGPV